VVAAPVPARIIEKGLVSDRVVIDTLIAKYSDHLPLYRQSVMLERETGLEISRATMDGWVSERNILDLGRRDPSATAPRASNEPLAVPTVDSSSVT